MAALSLMASCAQQQNYDATGTFEAKVVTVSAESSGKIMSFAVEEGQRVSANETVGLIDTVQLSLQRQQLQRQQESILKNKPDVGKQVAALRRQIAVQEKELARVEALVKDDAVPKKQYDDIQAQIGILQSQLNATLSSLGSSSASIESNATAIELQMQQIDDRLAKCQIASPIHGVVLAKYAEAGELAVQGKPLMKVADLDKMYLRAYFTSDQLSKVSLGQKVTVVADFGGGERYEYEGTVTWIATESEFTPKNIQTRNSRANLVYAAKIAVKNDGKLKIGLYGEVRF